MSHDVTLVMHIHIHALHTRQIISRHAMTVNNVVIWFWSWLWLCLWLWSWLWSWLWLWLWLCMQLCTWLYSCTERGLRVTARTESLGAMHGSPADVSEFCNDAVQASDFFFDALEHPDLPVQHASLPAQLPLKYVSCGEVDQNAEGQSSDCQMLIVLVCLLCIACTLSTLTSRTRCDVSAPLLVLLLQSFSTSVDASRLASCAS